MAKSKELEAGRTIKDEPGTEQRFAKILKRALNTPPPRKRETAKSKRAAKGKR